RARLLGAYGREDNADVQENLVKLNHEAPRDFPPAVLAEAAALPAAPAQADMDGREDLRALPLVTIDGADARDFDDAVQVERKGTGWLLRVAIADVSHYVRPAPGKGRASLDAEALERGNSWYFPRSVEPMLPPALSNGLCSLNPDEDRLAVLAEIPFSAAGQPGKARFALCVMRSAARLTYDQVRACLLDHDADALALLREKPRGGEALAMLEEAFRLYAVLRAVRRQRGSLDFDLPEADYTFDAAGRLRRIGFRQRHDAHRMIEEFMIAANEAVARHLRDAGLPFLYRVHPRPDPERLENLFDSLAATALESLPENVKSGGKADAMAMQAILKAAQGTDQEFLVNRLCLRAMPQARYQPENEGHFGLASQAYCHFTSPIRRYADLLVHRALKASLGRAAGPLPAGHKLLRMGDRLNRLERATMECEREMARRLACLALRDREGERFSGIIAGVTDFGLFVELVCMPVEGMIRVQDLGDDWYELDSRNQCLMGQRSGLCWRLGQRLEVRLAEVHMGRLEIRLMPLECPRRAARGQGKQGRGKQRALRRVQEGAQRSRRKRGQKNGQAHDRNKDRSRKQGARTGKTGGGRPKRGR
ncbi:VacB/RNase II family 3'-5' exoribonuclease, partial [uncultured Desulfovibrio sp.]|uniref:ribonuclease R family protein n=1 Tax=uncultured Desulfovibrio sp. TaxID=167968 RepID=UPI00262021B5